MTLCHGPFLRILWRQTARSDSLHSPRRNEASAKTVLDISDPTLGHLFISRAHHGVVVHRLHSLLSFLLLFAVRCELQLYVVVMV